MSLLTKVLGRRMGLPPASHPHVLRQRDLAATMPDGVVLLANRWFPAGVNGGMPTVLMRTPYGRKGAWAFEAWLLAERGFNVVVQSCRGTHGSGGEWQPFRNERADGIATLEWLSRQNWFDGRLATYGSSYCGVTQYALANGAPPGAIGAMAPSVAAADLRQLFYPCGVLSLQTLASWIYGLDPKGERSLLETLRMFRAAKAAQARVASALPVREADLACLGRVEQFYRDWVDHPELEDPYWQPLDHRAGLLSEQAPVTLLGGWYDFFTPYLVADVVTLQSAGRMVELTLGPWNHGGGVGNRLRNAVSLFDRVLKGNDTPAREKPVHVQLEGDKRWLHFASWPPPAGGERWYLQAGQALALSLPSRLGPDTFTYDPLDPPPSCGGASLDKGGPVDNVAREARSDVVCYTSAPLAADLVVIGPTRARVHIRCSTAYFDVVLRLCIVGGDGVSRNLSDGVVRVTPGSRPDEDGVVAVDVDLWPVGAVFAKGQRLRLQVSAALHPLFARNLGTADSLAGTEVVVSTHEVFHDREHPSYVELPVVRLTQADVLHAG